MLESLKRSRITILLYQIALYLKTYPSYVAHYRQFVKAKDKRFAISWSGRYPSLEDNTGGHPYDFHYVYHTSWAARRLKKIKPTKHIDISSSLYFSTIASAFVPIDFYDFRLVDISLSNLHSKEGNLMKLPFKTDSLASLSCMHVVEHIGLGRYGDPIDPQGDIKAINELKRVVQKGGSLLFVTPIGAKAKIAFNSHRIYTKAMILSYFKEFKLKEFAYISEHHPEKGLQTNPSARDLAKDSYSTACFWFIKK